MNTIKRIVIAALALFASAAPAADYYAASGDPAVGSALSSAVIRAEYSAIAVGFAKVAPYTGNASKAVIINSGGTGQTVTTGTLGLAGNFATTGAFNTTLVQGANVSLTLPTTNATLAILGAQSFTGLQTFNAGISVPTGQNVTGVGTAQVTGFATISGTTLTGTLSTAAQPNVISVGTLSGLTVTAAPTFSALTATRVPFAGTAGLLSDSASLTYASGTGTLTATTFSGALTGNASTATALAANPADCALNQFANAIAASGDLSCSALTLAGAQFANQGTATTVLHGNAAGNPTWGAVSLTADVSGILPTANGGTGIAYFTASGPTVARVYTFPDAAATILYSGGPLGTPSSGVATNLTGTASGLSIGGAAPAGSLTGTTLASNVVTSSLTSVGTLTSLTLGGALVGPATANVFNTVSTTVNAFQGASTALNIGHASGTNTVAGATTFSQAVTAANYRFTSTVFGALTGVSGKIGNDTNTADIGTVVVQPGTATGEFAVYDAGATGRKFTISQTAGASRLPDGIRLGADSTNNLLDDASNGAGTATLYIGNASINVTSDERLKSNIRPLADGMSIVNALIPIKYDQDEERPWGDVRHYVGFGARHTHKIAPWSVNTQGDTGLPWKMRQEFLMAPVVRAVQQIDARLLKLESQLKAQ